MPELPLVFAVVDDDAAMRRLLRSLIEGGGDTVIDAGSVVTGEVVLREYPWDVAIVDRGLPDGDGLNLCRSVRAAVEGTHRHVMIVSAAGSQDEKLEGFAAGADEYIAKPINPVELRARLRAIRRAVAAQKALLARLAILEQLSVIDGLTELYNHTFFEAELRRLFDIASRHQRPLALAMIDIDHFKNVNDTYGHRTGDLVLREVSTIIAQNVRASDVLARYGGEEFAMLLPETTLAESVAAADRIRTAVESAVIRDGTLALRVTISAGVASVPTAEFDTSARLVEAADRALYAAKNAGRNRVGRFSTTPDSIATDRAFDAGSVVVYPLPLT